MATKGNLDVALRIQADVADALTQLRAVRGELGDLKSEANKPSSASATALEQTATASRDAATALDGVAASEAQAASAARRRAEALARTAGTTEQQAEQARRYEEFLRRQAAGSEEARRAAASEDAAFRKLLGTLDPTASKTQLLAEQQQRLAAAFAAGKIGQAQYNALLAETERRFKSTGVSAGQTTQAMRQLPSQITDIFTGLTSGQSPLTVLIQQGGQIKDSFGGIGPAARALTSAISPMTLAIAGAAAVAGTLVLALHQLQAEQAAYSASLVASNNAAGTSIDQMRQYARQISAVQGTTGAAADAIAQLVATGRVSGGVLEQAATVAIRSQRLLGREVSATVAIYAQLGKDPVQTLLRLNEGTNFLTAGILRQVMALKSQGDDLGAAALAQKAYGEQQAKVLADAEKNLGTLQRAWKGVADFAKQAWDAMLNVGREKSLQERIDELRKALEAPQRRGGNPLQNDQRREAMREQLDALLEQQKVDKQSAAAQAGRVADNQRQLDELDGGRAGARAGLRKAQIADELAARLASLERERQASDDFFREDEISAQQHQENLLAIDQAGLQARLDALAQQRAVAAARPTKDLNDQLASKAELVALDTQRLELEQKISDLLREEAIGARDIVPKARSDVRDALRAFKAQDEANVVDFLKNDLQEKLKALQRVRDEIEAIFSRDSTVNQRLDADVRAFRKTPGEAADERVQRARVTANELDEKLPSLQARVDDLPEGSLERSKAVVALEALKQRIVELRGELGLLGTTLRDTFAGGLANALEGLATGTLSLRDAARGLLLDIARGMARVAAQELASIATKKLLILLTGEQASATVGAQATQAGAAAGAITTVAGVQTAASAQVAAAAAPAAAATATWSFGAAALAGLAALAAIYALAKGLEDGGPIRGPGTGTSDSIPIWASNGEFMVRERSASEPGAREFLEAFNARGMRALQAWQEPFRGLAEGGMVMPSSMPGTSTFKPATPVLQAGNVDASLQVLNLFDIDDLADRLAQSKRFRRSVTNVVVDERGTIQGGWGG